MLKYLARLYVRKIVLDAVHRGNDGDLYDLFQTIHTEARAQDTESNDSTVFAWLTGKFSAASRQPLPYVSDILRPSSVWNEGRF